MLFLLFSGWGPAFAQKPGGVLVETPGTILTETPWTVSAEKPGTTPGSDPAANSSKDRRVEVIPRTPQGRRVADPDTCRFSSPSHVITDEDGLLLHYWIEADRPIFAEPVLPRTPSLDTFRQAISQQFDTDARAILEAQLDQVDGPDRVNVELVLTGEVGTLRPMSCLEALLLASQTDRSETRGTSMFDEPTEFLSYVLARDGALKIYQYTVDQPGIGRVGPIHDPVEADLAQGWRVVKNIHNHNFFPLSEQPLGGVAPSATDVQAFRGAVERLGLRRASITNGFHSLEMSADDFRILAVWEP